MKTVDVVTTARGWYVTLRYCGQNRGIEFFPFDKKGARKTNEKKRDKFIKEWLGT